MSNEQKMKQNAAQVHRLITEIDADPHNTENYLRLATLLVEAGSFDQARQLLEKAQTLVENPQDLDYDLAVCYYLQGEFTKSLQLLEQIPNDDLVLYQKALVFLKIGQAQKALAYALTIKKSDERVNELLGDIWLALGSDQAAKASFEDIAPTQRTAKVNFRLGIATLASDRDQAEKYLHRAQKQDPQYFGQAQKQYAAILKMINHTGKDNG
ncbi:tetratricopeptide repeat protein [Lactobacillus xylocopicola]|uniref:Tetratricopeptide repeat protein n=1 Tax=Lactobacillus xylocopicola TaxID=2976676 RepID=A0ABM8BGM9_9LACO|nr:tetratricopeptide repeat protein [Lactobacillus xylocopicola]BDR60415.1 hypothetical protein KIM322_06760 [Lactobacillus xylocopicola]